MQYRFRRWTRRVKHALLPCAIQRPGAPSRVEVIHLHMRQTQGHRNMAGPAVHPDNACASSQRTGQRQHVPARPNHNIRNRGCDGCCGFSFCIVGLRDGQSKTELIQLQPERDPVRQWPCLVRAGGAVHQRHGTGRDMRVRGGEQRLARLCALGITQCLRAHMASTLHRVAAPSARHRDIGHPTRGRFVGRALCAIGHGNALAFVCQSGQASDPRRFGEAL
jgi:hypothetical protein